MLVHDCGWSAPCQEFQFTIDLPRDDDGSLIEEWVAAFVRGQHFLCVIHHRPPFTGLGMVYLSFSDLADATRFRCDFAHLFARQEAADDPSPDAARSDAARSADARPDDPL